MALTASTNYTITKDDLIKASLRLLVVGSVDEDPTQDEIDQAAVTLNIMLKAWQVHGLQLWQIRNYTLTPVASQVQYSLGASNVGSRPMRITDIYRRETATNTDVPMIKLSREEYWRLPDKTNTGTPINYYPDMQLDNLVLNVWPAPDATFAAGSTFQILYQKPFDDMDVLSTDSFEFPSEWYEPIKYGLATRLAPEYGIARLDRRELRMEAKEILDAVLGWDQEDSSVYLAPRQR